MNKLKLNADKTEAIMICSPRINNKISLPHIQLVDTTVPVSTVARNIVPTTTVARNIVPTSTVARNIVLISTVARNI
ncbi:hypothetical protein LSAT2_021732, partial [Lamellibrachia satsuma]